MPRRTRKRVKHNVKQNTIEEDGPSHGESKILPQLKPGWAYEPDYPRIDKPSKSARPLNKLARDRGWEPIPASASHFDLRAQLKVSNGCSPRAGEPRRL